MRVIANNHSQLYWNIETKAATIQKKKRVIGDLDSNRHGPEYFANFEKV
jgi:hypothetical protein